jgi:hypothetical protein
MAGKPSLDETLTCIWWQVEDKDGQESDENARGNDIDQVEEWLPSDNEVEGDFLPLSFSPSPRITWRLD